MYVCDFGLTQMKSKDVESLKYDPHGTPLYMAPEVFVGEWDEKCDVYSFGIIMWEILTLKQVCFWPVFFFFFLLFSSRFDRDCFLFFSFSFSSFSIGFRRN